MTVLELGRPQTKEIVRPGAGERSAVLIVNTLSRRGQRLYAKAKDLIAQKGLVLARRFPVRQPERLPEIVDNTIAEGHKLIIVGGGDGTISSVVDHLAHTDVVLGILPLGTANSFARTLGMPLDLDGAVDVLVKGKAASVDLGMINDDYFANGASIGLPTAIARAMPYGLKRWFGRVGYLMVASERFFKHKPFRVAVTIDGQARTYDAFDIRIANGGYQGGVLVAEEAHLESGDIVLHILTGPSKWSLPKEWARAILRLSFRPADIEVLRAPEMTIETDPPQDVGIDGEVVTQTPIRVSVAHKALRLMVPPDFPGGAKQP